MRHHKNIPGRCSLKQATILYLHYLLTQESYLWYTKNTQLLNNEVKRIVKWVIYKTKGFWDHYRITYCADDSYELRVKLGRQNQLDLNLEYGHNITFRIDNSMFRTWMTPDDGFINFKDQKKSVNVPMLSNRIGKISWIGDACPGSWSDMKTLEENMDSYFDYVDSRDIIVGDTQYYTNTKRYGIITPLKKDKGKEISTNKKVWNDILYARRNAIENCFSPIREKFRVLKKGVRVKVCFFLLIILR